MSWTEQQKRNYAAINKSYRLQQNQSNSLLSPTADIQDITLQLRKIRESFYKRMMIHTKMPYLNYYDFLIIAKKQNFRFQDTRDLVLIKQYFQKCKNCVDKRMLVEMLNLNPAFIDKPRQVVHNKKIVKFEIPSSNIQNTPIIMQVLNQSQENIRTQGNVNEDNNNVRLQKIDKYNKSSELLKYRLNNVNSKTLIANMDSNKQSQKSLNKTYYFIKQQNLDAKIQQIQSKIWYLNKYYSTLLQKLFNSVYSDQYFKLQKNINTLNQGYHKNLPSPHPKINYTQFYAAVQNILQSSDNPTVQSSKQQDIKFIFDILDYSKLGEITQRQIFHLKQPKNVLQEIRNRLQKYKGGNLRKINNNSLTLNLNNSNPTTPLNTKHTKTNLQKIKNQSQIKLFQIGNQSDLQTIITNQNRQFPLFHPNRNYMMKKRPKFGPLRQTTMTMTRRQIYDTTKPYNSKPLLRDDKSILVQDIWDKKQKFYQMIKNSKARSQRKSNNKNSKYIGLKDTVSNKLRSLFIHKIILPRQKIMQDQKLDLQIKMKKKLDVSTKKDKKLIAFN